MRKSGPEGLVFISPSISPPPRRGTQERRLTRTVDPVRAGSGRFDLPCLPNQVHLLRDPLESKRHIKQLEEGHFPLSSTPISFPNPVERRGRGRGGAKQLEESEDRELSRSGRREARGSASSLHLRRTAGPAASTVPRRWPAGGAGAEPPPAPRTAGPSPRFEIPSPLCCLPGAGTPPPYKGSRAAAGRRAAGALQSDSGWDRAGLGPALGVRGDTRSPSARGRPSPAEMPAPGASAAARLLLALAALALGGRPLPRAGAALNSVLLNSNAIKNSAPPLGGAAGHAGSAVSAAPGTPFEGGNKYQALDHYQPFPCAEDEECGPDEYCSAAARAGGAGAQICLACRKRRKRCLRHAMCCPGNYCKNGICMPSDHSHFHRGEIEETIIESFGNDHGTLDGYSRRTTLSSKIYHTKGQEGSVCLRSSDCATGLCCARHFWSKICKPVLKEGQVCTKHRRKGSHGLEIFQRCYCGEGLSCRIQKDHHQASNSSRLHTCQRH
ncbi:PREDICTED: dickkopf-related protein 1 [Chinchilla lanigera]|uniref:dickkopf-related protein 1 n=1 Tax=Chinchilla lanigera TaxID=34839 RepID=UPI0006975CD1|nr:PREDICTED: dickkopf-related protein 1 [Chinchilla lanigera]